MGMKKSSVGISSSDTRVHITPMGPRVDEHQERPVTPQQNNRKGVLVLGVRKPTVWPTSVLVPTDEPGLLTGQVAI
jgi:hypothetical protein